MKGMFNGMKKLVACVIVFVAIVFVVDSLEGVFSDSGFEKELENSLPYELRVYTMFDEDYSEHVLGIKDFKIDKHVTNGNYDTADCTIVLEDENIKKIMYVTLYSTKYNTGWRVDSYSENKAADVVPKYAADEYLISEEISEKGYKNYSISNVDYDFSDGYYSVEYDIYDAYDYAEFLGKIEVEAEFVEVNDGYIPSYGWTYSSEYYVDVNWKVKGRWILEWNDGNVLYLYSGQKIIYNIYDDISQESDLIMYGNSVCYHYSLDGSTVYTCEDDNLICQMRGSNPNDATLSLRNGCVELFFTCYGCEAYADDVLDSELSQSIIHE